MRKCTKPESKIEQMLCEGVRRAGGRAYKLISPGKAGIPDRLVCLPGGTVIFAELKTEKGKLTKMQELRITELEKMGQRVCVLYGEDDVKNFIDGIRR